MISNNMGTAIPISTINDGTKWYVDEPISYYNNSVCSNMNDTTNIENRIKNLENSLHELHRKIDALTGLMLCEK